MLTISPPTFATGALLSASMLNTLSECANALQGASVAPAGTFIQNGVNQTWYLRRKWRYLHVAYGLTLHTADNLAVSIDFGTGGGGDYTHTSSIAKQWRTYDLQAVGSTTVGVFYGVTVTRAGNDFDFNVLSIMESDLSTPDVIASGNFVTPPTWTAGETVTAAKLNQISGSIASMASVLRTPSHVTLAADETYIHVLRRKMRYVQIQLTVGGSTPDVDIYVNGTKSVNNAVTNTYTVDLTTLGTVPAVGTPYTVSVVRNDGTFRLLRIGEVEITPTSYAPDWNHGEQISTDVKLDSYATVLNAAQAILGDAGWHYAAIHRPLEHPIWYTTKSKRYLHYMRQGSTAATIEDPGGVYDSIGLSSTTIDEPFASYDLDTVEWLMPGGVFRITEADVVWLDDEA